MDALNIASKSTHKPWECTGFPLFLTCNIQGIHRAGEKTSIGDRLPLTPTGEIKHRIEQMEENDQRGGLGRGSKSGTK